MTRQQRFRFSYYGWTVEFSTPERDIRELRRLANTKVLDRHGPEPSPSYAQPRLPFPDFVPAQVWEGQDGWQPYL